MTLTHQARWQLASDLVNRMVASHPGQIALGAVYGSTARGTDTAWSDLELWFAARPGSDIPSGHAVYRDIAVGWQVHDQAKLEASLAAPTADWPFLMGVISVLRVLYGDADLPNRWLDMGRSAPQAAFRQLLQQELPGLVVESYGRIRSCQLRGQTDGLLASVWEVLMEMKHALCLLNRRWVTHDYRQGLMDSTAFPLLPDRYAELVSALWKARHIDRILPLANELYANYLDLLRREGVPLRSHERVEEIKL